MKPDRQIHFNPPQQYARTTNEIYRLISDNAGYKLYETMSKNYTLILTIFLVLKRIRDYYV